MGLVSMVSMNVLSIFTVVRGRVAEHAEGGVAGAVVVELDGDPGVGELVELADGTG